MKMKEPPFLTGTPRTMLPLEQVLCMIYLADVETLPELRKRQGLIDQQLSIAVDKNLPETTLLDLEMMRENATAAVAYQNFPDDAFWVAFIKR